MRSLWQLLYRYHLLLFFLLLEAGAFALLVRSNNHHRASYIHAANRVTGTLYERRAVVAEYLRLQSINEELARENAFMRSERPDAFLKLGDNIYLYEDTLYLRRYSYTPARVVNNSVNRVKNFITIDKGSKHGIDREMGVIAKGSVVGIVKEVSEHFATVMPLINTSLNVSVELKRSGAFGRVSWDGKDPTLAKVIEVPRYANPMKGDTVVSTGFSAYFPEDMLVGFVESYHIPEGENFYDISIRLSTEFHHLSYVEVVVNHQAEEQRALELQSEGGQDE